MTRELLDILKVWDLTVKRAGRCEEREREGKRERKKRDVAKSSGLDSSVKCETPIPASHSCQSQLTSEPPEDRERQLSANRRGRMKRHLQCRIRSRSMLARRGTDRLPASPIEHATETRNKQKEKRFSSTKMTSSPDLSHTSLSLRPSPDSVLDNLHLYYSMTLLLLSLRIRH